MDIRHILDLDNDQLPRLPGVTDAGFLRPVLLRLVAEEGVSKISYCMLKEKLTN